jgi:hypothetical protein
MVDLSIQKSCDTTCNVAVGISPANFPRSQRSKFNTNYEIDTYWPETYSHKRTDHISVWSYVSINWVWCKRTHTPATGDRSTWHHDHFKSQMQPCIIYCRVIHSILSTLINYSCWPSLLLLMAASSKAKWFNVTSLNCHYLCLCWMWYHPLFAS